MTKAQSIILRYLKTQFEGVTYGYIGDDKVIVTDYTGKSMTFTMNVFCDIMDCKTREIIAVSDLPHDLTKIGTKLPHSWKNQPSYFK